MAFGQASGPPATGKQMRELEELLELAGHSDFRDARGPMGFTQRQAGGKFTRDEADAFIEQLQDEVHGDGPPSEVSPAATASPKPAFTNARPKAAKPSPAKSRKTTKLEDVSTEDLAAELQSRGWVVMEP